jgi:hypothetical protein
MMVIFKTRKFRLVLGLAAGLTAIFLFYAEELWRGERAWEHCRRSLELRGIPLDWAHYIPGPVADDENVFGVPAMHQWFCENSDLSARLAPAQQPKPNALDPKTADSFLQSNAKFNPDFNLMREALRRPSTRIPDSYGKHSDIPRLNIQAWYAVVRTMSTRARCHLLLNQPGAAVEDISLMDDISRRLLEAQKPVTLEAAWFDMQGKGGCARLIAEGICSNAWGGSQLTAMEDRLKSSNVLPVLTEALAFEREAVCCNAVPASLAQLARMNYSIDDNHVRQGDWNAFVARMSPHGWAYLGSAAVVDLDTRVIDALRPDEQWAGLKALKSAIQDFEGLSPHWAPKAYLEKFPLDLDKVCQTMLFTQTQINETLVACALERCRLAQGNYPATLDELAPRFIDKIPCDVINGGPLRYHLSETGTFTLYSIGWNKRDDGGARSSESYPFTTGDWVWQVKP